MRSHSPGRVRRLAAAAALALGATAGAILVTTNAQAATSVRVESQITAHNLPYPNSPYIAGSALAGGEYAPIECSWFFARGYWLHSSRIEGNPNGNGYGTCRGYSHPDSARIAATINAATSMLGRYPYSWGGGGKSGPSYGTCCSPSGRDGTHVYGFDCSGLTQYAFWQGAGVDIGSTSYSQYVNGYKVALSQRRAGDLIFWSDSSETVSKIHHVALYVGSGKGSLERAR